MSTTALVAAAIALGGALFALVALPKRQRGEAGSAAKLEVAAA